LGPKIWPMLLPSLTSQKNRFPSHPPESKTFGLSSKNLIENILLACPGEL